MEFISLKISEDAQAVFSFDYLIDFVEISAVNKRGEHFLLDVLENNENCVRVNLSTIPDYGMYTFSLVTKNSEILLSLEGNSLLITDNLDWKYSNDRKYFLQSTRPSISLKKRDIVVLEVNLTNTQQLQVKIPKKVTMISPKVVIRRQEKNAEEIEVSASFSDQFITLDLSDLKFDIGDKYFIFVRDEDVNYRLYNPKVKVGTISPILAGNSEAGFHYYYFSINGRLSLKTTQYLDTENIVHQNDKIIITGITLTDNEHVVLSNRITGDRMRLGHAISDRVVSIDVGALATLPPGRYDLTLGEFKIKNTATNLLNVSDRYNYISTIDGASAYYYFNKKGTLCFFVTEIEAHFESITFDTYSKRLLIKTNNFDTVERVYTKERDTDHIQDLVFDYRDGNLEISFQNLNHDCFVTSRNQTLDFYAIYYLSQDTEIKYEGRIKFDKTLIRTYYPKQPKEIKFGYEQFSEERHLIISPYLTVNHELSLILSQTYYQSEWSSLEINDKKVLYEAFQGGQIGDSPFAFFQELATNTQYSDLKHVWVLSEKNQDLVLQLPKSLQDKVEVVITGTKSYFDALLTAKYLFNTATFPAWFIKKPGQIYTNTWHGTAHKTLGYDMAGGRSIARNQVRNFLMTDYMISPNAHMTHVFRDSYKLEGAYDGQILEGGYPRIDLTLNIDKTSYIQELVAEGIRINSDKATILVAPTWRGSTNTDPKNNIFELITLLDKLLADFGMTYNVLLKVHQLQYNYAKDIPELQGYLIPDYAVTNKIIAIADVLVTDFSSIFFDYLVTNKPIIFTLDDAESYSKERGYYFDLETLPGYITHNYEELKESLDLALSEPIPEDIQIRYSEYQNRFVSYDDGNVTNRYLETIMTGSVVDGIKVHDIRTDKKRLLIYPGSMMNNGITTSFINLMSILDKSRYDVTVIIDPQVDRSRLANISKIPEDIRLMYRYGQDSLNYSQRIYDQTYNLRSHEDDIFEGLDLSGYDLDMKRIIPFKPDAAIHFSGYENKWGLRIAAMDAKKKIVFQHNDLREDADKFVNDKQPNLTMLTHMFELYRYYDKVVSVSGKLREINIEKLRDYIQDKQSTDLRNTIDYQHISELRKNYGDFYKIKKDIVGKKFNYNPDNINYVVIGRLSTEKNHKALIRAFANFSEVHSKAKLYIVGDGLLLNELQKLVEKLNATKVIQLLGQRPNPYVILDQMDYLVLPSLHEGQPVVLLEAMTMDKRILASNIAPNVAVLGENEQYGMLTNGIDEGSLYYGLLRSIDWDIETQKFDVVKYNSEILLEFDKLVSED